MDFLLGMGALKSKIVISLPASVYKFQLKDPEKNTPKSPFVLGPQRIDQSEVRKFHGRKQIPNLKLNFFKMFFSQRLNQKKKKLKKNTFFAFSCVRCFGKKIGLWRETKI